MRLRLIHDKYFDSLSTFSGSDPASGALDPLNDSLQTHVTPIIWVNTPSLPSTGAHRAAAQGQKSALGKKRLPDSLEEVDHGAPKGTNE